MSEGETRHPALGPGPMWWGRDRGSEGGAAASSAAPARPAAGSGPTSRAC